MSCRPPREEEETEGQTGGRVQRVDGGKVDGLPLHFGIVKVSSGVQAGRPPP